MPWFHAHRAGLIALLAVLEVGVFAALGHTRQYAPSLLAARFVPYPLYLILPAVTSCAIGAGLRIIPIDLESISARPTARLAMTYTTAITVLKCVLTITLLPVIPHAQVSGYIFNTLIFVGLTIILPLPARMTVWIPVAALYLCIFIGADGEVVHLWAPLAKPEASRRTIALGAMFFVVSVVAMAARHRGIRSARVENTDFE